MICIILMKLVLSTVNVRFCVKFAVAETAMADKTVSRCLVVLGLLKKLTCGQTKRIVH